jgi:membrane-bound serine protease (ClpP class)
VRRLASQLAAALIVALPLTVAMAPSVGAQRGCGEDGCVRVLRISGLIDPIIVEFVEQSVIDVEATEGYVGVVLEIDSDGSVISDAELERFVAGLQTASVPVSAWIGTGSQARGGAAELVMALPNSGMAAGSRLGEIGSPRLSRSVLERPPAGAASEIRSRTISAGRAVELGLVRFAVPTFPQYLAQLSGVRTATTEVDGTERLELLTRVVFSKPELGQQLLHTIASPAVTYLMLGIGLGLLIFEFFTAGVGIAGVIGAGAALGASYGFGVLPFRTWALVCCVVAALAFAIDIQAGVPRVWTGIGLILWTAGSVFLFESVHLPLLALLSGILGMAVAMVSGMPAMVRARFGTPTIGREWMVGELAEVVEPVNPDGVVRLRGALWRARTNRATPIAVGESARVVHLDGLTLEVEPESGGAMDYRERRRGHRGDAAGGGTTDRSRR